MGSKKFFNEVHSLLAAAWQRTRDSTNIPPSLPPNMQPASQSVFRPPSNWHGPTSILACVMQQPTQLSCRRRASSACATHEKPRDGKTEERPPACLSHRIWSLTHSLRSSLSAICQRLLQQSHCNKLPNQQGGRTDSFLYLTYSDNLTPDSDLVSENLRQPLPSATAVGPILLLSPHSLYLSILLPSYPLLLSRYPNKNCYNTNEWSARPPLGFHTLSTGTLYEREYDRGTSVRLSDPILWPAIREPSLPFLSFPSFLPSHFDDVENRARGEN